jgi:hypothetical protein
MQRIPICRYIFAVSLLAISLASPLTAGETTGKTLDPSYQIAVALGPFATAADAANGARAINWDGSDPVRMNASTEAFAALELRHFLCRLTKASEQDSKVFPVVAMNRYRSHKAIILGDLSEKSPNPAVSRAAQRENLVQRLSSRESFALVPDGENLLIIGSDRVGVLYGVYSLLQMLGVRWYAPGDLGEVIQESASLHFPAQTIIQEPRFLTRGFWAWQNRGNNDFLLWMARNRLNLWTIADDRASAKQLGLQLDAGAHFVFERYLNPATYMQAHPEWYGLVNGKRQGFKNEFGVNFCTSNPAAVREFIQNLVADLSTGDWRDTDLLELWALDDGKWCECENCKRLGTPTDRLLKLVMQVRDALEDARRKGLIHHQVKVVFPIYSETLSAPSNPQPTTADYKNLIGTFFPIGRCYIHYLDDPNCTEYNTQYWETFQMWRKQPDKYAGQFEIGEYYNVSTTKSLPVLCRRIMAHDLPLFYSNGVRHFHYMHVAIRLQGPKRLNNYLMAQLLWNPDADVEQLFSEYLNDFYGAGAGDARRFYDRLEFAMSSIQQWKHYGGEHGGQCLVEQINRDADVLFGTEHLKLEEYHPAQNAGVSLGESVRALQECRTIMDRLRARDLPGAVKLRLAEDDRNLRYAENTVNLYYYLAQAMMAKKQQNLDQARRFYRLTVPFAEGLRNETEIPQTSYLPNSRDGLDASLVEKTYEELGKQLGVASNPGLRDRTPPWGAGLARTADLTPHSSGRVTLRSSLASKFLKASCHALYGKTVLAPGRFLFPNPRSG